MKAFIAVIFVIAIHALVGAVIHPDIVFRAIYVIGGSLNLILAFVLILQQQDFARIKERGKLLDLHWAIVKGKDD